MASRLLVVETKVESSSIQYKGGQPGQQAPGRQDEGSKQTGGRETAGHDQAQRGEREGGANRAE